MTGRRQRGFGISEVMVALVVGLLVTLTASAMLVGAGGNFQHHGAHARLNDNGRFALELIGQALRQGGFVNFADGGQPDDASEAMVSGLDAGIVSRSSPGIDTPQGGAINGSDVLALRFSGSGSGAGDGSALNCAGFAEAYSGTPAWSIFYVGLSEDGEPELRCKYKGDSSWSSDAIVRGVDSFQVLYGLDTDTPPDGTPNRYLNASAIRALDAALVLDGSTPDAQAADLRRKTHWKRVASLRVALLLHGELNSRQSQTDSVYQLFGPAYDARGDPGTVILEEQWKPELRQRARRLFEASYAVRNVQR
jgi:type IV pilus assembly protein PilW